MLRFAELDSQLSVFPQVPLYVSATAAGGTRNVATHYSAAINLGDCNGKLGQISYVRFVTRVSKSCSRQLENPHGTRL